MESDNDDGCPPFTVLVYGTQEWSGGNACNITYRDGTPIPQVTDNTEWSKLSPQVLGVIMRMTPQREGFITGMRLWVFTMQTLTLLDKEFAPEGWHVPTDTEWTSTCRSPCCQRL